MVTPAAFGQTTFFKHFLSFKIIFTTCKYVDIYAIPLHKSEQKNTAAWGTKPQAKPEQPASTSTAEGE